MIVTRRFWCTTASGRRALVVDVRTGHGVSDAQAQANAEGFAARKLPGRVYAIRVRARRSKPNFTIGPRR